MSEGLSDRQKRRIRENVARQIVNNEIKRKRLDISPPSQPAYVTSSDSSNGN